MVLIKKVCLLYISSLVFLSFQTLAQDKTAHLTGTLTTAISSPNDLNQTGPFALKWSSSDFDSTYFEHSTSSFSHQLKVKISGDYRVSFTMPLTLNDGSSNRRAILAEVYVNGSPISHGRMNSSYIRQGSSHNESSLHGVFLLDGLNANDTISVFVNQDVTSGEITTSGAQLFTEFIDPSRSIFSATATRTVSSTNLNQATASSLEWTENVKDSDFTHSDGASPENITLAAGDYLVFVNIPLEAVGCSNRNAPKALVQINGTTVTGGTASQAYIRCTEGHNKSSLHWSGIVSGVTAGQTLTIKTQRETNNSTTVQVPGSREASIFIEKIDSSNDVISLRGTQVLAGNNWNQSAGSEVQWNTQVAIDATTFSHNTGTNNHEITVNEDGNYFVIYNDHLSGSVNRANTNARVKVNNSAVATGSCKTHYIRNSEGHQESSCSLTHFLPNLSSGDEISIEHVLEAASGTVNDASPALLTVVKVSDATPPDCDDTVSCTPDLILHVDASDFTSVLDSSSRNANDISFAGSVATWKDISGSANIHNLTQTTASRQPSFDTTHMLTDFDGSNDFFIIANHDDLNTASSLKERSIIIAFKTGSDVTTPQILYEEGGTVRGMNVFIRAGKLYLGFWNINNDGDGSQGFTSANNNVEANTHYYASLVIDYSNYTGPAGPDGELRGHIDGVKFTGIGTTTSLLYAHSGGIGLGGMNNDSFFDTGATSGSTGHEFGGEIFELLIYNHAIDDTEATDFYDYLREKWPDPQPVTNLTLSSQYTSNSSQTPSFSWTASISNDVNRYEVALGTTQGGTEESAFSSVGLSTSTSITGLSLSECTNYFASIKAIDDDSNESEVRTTEFIRFDGTAPSDPSSLNLSGTSSTTTSKTLSWTASTDSCAFSHYEVAIGTSAGASDVVAFTDIGNTTSHQFTGITLSTSTDYFTSIRAVDLAGNTSSDVSSVAWQVDTCVQSDVTPPTNPSGVTVTGNGGPTSSPLHSWTASTDSCGLSHYEVAIGTSAGASDILTFTDIGNVLSHKVFSISPSLSTNTNYFTSVRAVDLAGNNSGSASSSAWQLPTPGGVSSGLVLWLDADDSGTLFTDAGCSTPVSDGNQIQCWKDKSTSANDASTSGAARPRWEDNEFNSKPVIRFDGTDDVVDFTSIDDIRTVFIVNKSNTSSFQQILGHTSTRHFFTSNAVLIGPTTSSVDLRTGNWRVDQTEVESPTTFTQTGSYSMISVVSSANVSADHIASDNKTSGRFFNGDVAEVIIYDRALTSNEIDAVEGYLNDKWFSAAPSAVTNLSFSEQYTASSNQSPTFSWTHSTAPDLDHYEVALGTSPGSNDIAGYTNVGLNNSHQFLGLSLSECTDIFASVRAVDTDGFVSSTVSTAFARFDGTNPTTASNLIISGNAAETQSKNLSWNAATDSCSFSHYEVALGTTSGGSDVIAFTDVGDTGSHQFTGITPDLSFATDYFMSIRAVDSAGNTSSVVSSSAWQLDTCVQSDVTPPSDPSSLILSGDSTVTRSRQLAWTSSSDSCAFSHYEVAIGTSAGASNVVAFTNVGDVSNHRFTDLASNLSFSTNYFLSVKAVDQAGNESSVISSAAWQLTTPGSVSATGMLLWLDGNDIATLYQNSACSTSVSSNDESVGCFKDKSGNDNHATNATGSNQPIYKTTNFNSKPSLYFDGVTDRFLNFTRFTNIRTVVWVLKEDSSNPGNTAFLLGDPNGSTAHFHRASTSGPIFHASSSSANVRGGTLKVDTITVDGTTTNMPDDESVISLVTSGNVTASSFSRDRTSCCGNRTWGGSLAELIIFNRALNSTEISNIEASLNAKWGIAATSTEWTGAVSTDWFNAANWSAGLPSSTVDCVIPDQTNDPIINAATGICRNIDITNGNLTLQNSSGATLAIHGNFENTGTFTQNDGTLELRDDGVSSSTQTIQSTSTLSQIRFDKTAGGTVTLVETNLAINDFNISSGNDFTFEIPNGNTLTLPNGLSMASATFEVKGGATLEVGSGQTLSVTGGRFKTSGTNDAFTQNTSNKATLTRQGGAGRWAFSVSGGEVDLTGFIIDFIDVNGLNISGSADLVSLDGGQFTHLDTDFATPVKAIQINTTSSLTENLASNVGFNWGAANALHSGTPSSSDNFFTVHAPACNNSTLVFDQWFGDFFDPATKLPATEDKIQDSDDGGSNCQISMTLAASPVNLLSFQAQGYNQSVVLEWETGAEIDHLGFNVLRSHQMHSGYTQINPQLIQNFLNSTTFRGKYRFDDENLTNGQTYYYMIEDISIDGKVVRHGPVSSTPQAALGAAPSIESDVNTPPEITIPAVDLGEGVDLIRQTQSTLRISITPANLEVSDASWDSNHKDIYIPGYSKTLPPGHPELLTRKILIEVPKAYSTIDVNEVQFSSSNETALLAAEFISPAPTWTLNSSTQVLEPQYNKDALAYDLDQLVPSSYYNVKETSLSINGRHYIEITVRPVKYNSKQNVLNKLTHLVLDIGLDGDAWDTPTPAPENQFTMAPASVEGALRIRYNKAGMYQLSFDDLITSNSDGPYHNADISILRLYYHGQEIPFELDSSDGFFNSGDSIRFWGPFEISNEDLLDEVVLSQFNHGPENTSPLRILSKDNQPSQFPVAPPSTHWTHLTSEENNLPIFDVPLGGIIDRFYWKRIFISGGGVPNAGARLDWTADLKQLNPQSQEDVQIEVQLRGRGAIAQNPIHSIALYVNNMSSAYEAQSFSGNDAKTLYFSVPANLFTTGANSFRLEATGATTPSGDFDIIDINKVNFKYNAFFKPINGLVHLTSSVAHQQVIIEGFSSSQISIYDLSNPIEAMKYQNAFIEDSGGSQFSVFFDTIPGDEQRSGKNLVVIDNSQFLSPTHLTLSSGRENSLRDPSNEADLIIVGAPSLLSTAYDLIAHRRSQGLKVFPVTVEAIDAEFSFGRKSSYGLRSFIQYSLQNWTVKPKYLLILGDATYDPKNYLENSQSPATLPVPLEKGDHTDFGSDNFFAESENSHLPQIAVGRIPTSDQNQLKYYIQKVLDYENGQRSPTSSGGKLGVFISGGDELNENFDDEVSKLSNSLQTVDQGFDVKKVHRAELGDDALTKTEIIEQFDRGPLLMTYMGHGAENLWGSNQLFNTTDAQNLTNQQLPIVMALNCLNTYFYDADPTVTSMGEEMLLNPDGGAIAFWGSTSMTAPVIQSNLATALLAEVGQKTSSTPQEVRLGDLFLNAKVSQGDQSYSKDTVRSWTLLGDPTLKLPTTSFKPAASDVGADFNEVTPVANESGGGGCSANANQNSQKDQTFLDILREVSFLLIVLFFWGSLKLVFRKRTL